MKRVMLVVALAMMIPGGVLMAADTDDAEIRVWVKVNPQIIVTPKPDAPFELSVSGDVITGLLTFEVHANVQEVDLSVEATCLYKADDPTSPHIVPIAGTGVLVQPAVGNATPPDDNFLEWLTPAVTGTANGDGTVSVVDGNPYSGGNGMTANTSIVQQFQSGQSNRFSQDVTVALEWLQIEPELPTGDYSGFVKLIGSVL